MDIKKIKQKIESLTYKLDEEERRLSKAIPTKPIVSDECKYNHKTGHSTLIHTYFCSYCGEHIRKNTKKHKCGKVHDWSEIL